MGRGKTTKREKTKDKTKRKREKTTKKTKSFKHPFQKNKEVPLSHIKGFEIIKSIGKGSFGKVYKARKDGVDCALKFVNLSNKKGDFEMERLVTQWLSEQKIGPFFIGSWTIPCLKLGVMASELWHGCLDDFMDDNDRRRVPKLVMDKITAQIKKLHRLKHAHMDLHGGNVFIKTDKTGKKVVDATIADFGKLAHVEHVEKHQIELPIDIFELKKTKCPKNIDHQCLKMLRSDYT